MKHFENLQCFERLLKSQNYLWHSENQKDIQYSWNCIENIWSKEKVCSAPKISDTPLEFLNSIKSPKNLPKWSEKLIHLNWPTISCIKLCNITGRIWKSPFFCCPRRRIEGLFAQFCIKQGFLAPDYIFRLQLAFEKCDFAI